MKWEPPFRTGDEVKLVKQFQVGWSSIEGDIYSNETTGENTTAKQDKDFVEVRCSVCKAIHRVHPSEVK